VPYICKGAMGLLLSRLVGSHVWGSVVDSFIGKVYQRRKPVRDRVPT
jgi:hypothetical protein